MLAFTHWIKAYTIGAAKYEDRNWEKGLSWGRTFAAMLRHSVRWACGEQFDPVDGQHHLAAVMWNAAALLQFEITHPELNDLTIDPKVAEAVLALFETEKQNGKAASQESETPAPSLSTERVFGDWSSPEVVYAGRMPEQIVETESDIVSIQYTISSKTQEDSSKDISPKRELVKDIPEADKPYHGPFPPDACACGCC